MQKKIAQSAIAVTLVALVSGGCAATRFSPPEVNLDYPVTKKTVGTSCSKGITYASEAISEDFKGAMNLLDNFMVGYRCAAQSAADGRTKFEVPTFLLATTAAVGQSFGISEDWTLGLATGAAATRQGNSYFAPQAKADYLNSAVDALTCIQLESVGIDGFDLQQKPAENDNKDANSGGLNFESLAQNNGTVEFTAQRQYFRMISGALLSVERVLARRLNHAGTPFDPAGILAEISMLTKEIEEDKPKQDDMMDGGEDANEVDMALMPLEVQISGKRQELKTMRETSPDADKSIRQASNELIILETKLLQPKLQKCIILAKI